MDFLMALCMVITGINIVLILMLLYVFIRNLSKIKSYFTIGLVLFAGLFLLHDAVIMYSYFGLLEYYVTEIKLFVFAFSVLQAFAFGTLNVLTWR